MTMTSNMPCRYLKSPGPGLLSFLRFHVNSLSGSEAVCPLVTDCQPRAAAGGLGRSRDAPCMVSRDTEAAHHPHNPDNMGLLRTCSRSKTVVFHRWLSKRLSDQNFNIRLKIYCLNLTHYREKGRASWKVVGLDLSQGSSLKAATNTMLPLSSQFPRQANHFPGRTVPD